MLQHQSPRSTRDDPIDRLRSALAGRYAVEWEVGRGGMSRVYAARDLRHGRRVAIKVLRPELATILGADRFLREIEIAARLQHPHILPLFDSGEAGDLLFYVMPFVTGETLRARLARMGRLTIADAARIGREVTDALGYAHREGVVHRDIKPENVMLGAGHAYVMDFGIAKALSEATDHSGITSAGLTLGTPAYMAPEQAAAAPTVDHRADIYALGTLLYEMLAGHTPFSDSTAQRIFARQMTEAPAPIQGERAGYPGRNGAGHRARAGEGSRPSLADGGRTDARHRVGTRQRHVSTRPSRCGAGPGWPSSRRASRWRRWPRRCFAAAARRACWSWARASSSPSTAGSSSIRRCRPTGRCWRTSPAGRRRGSCT